MKTIIHPVTGRRYRLGRLRPSAEVLARPRLRLVDYLTAPLPSPPVGPLKRLVPLSKVAAQMYGNDVLGDCTIAGKAKGIGAFSGLAAPPAIIFDSKTVEAEYFRLTGGGDTGLDEITVLEDWRDNANSLLGDHRIAGFAAVDATNQIHTRFAVWAFELAYLGLELPNAYLDPPPSENGFVWKKSGAPNADNGHCIVAIDYVSEGLIVLTWGLWGIMEWDAVAAYLSAAGEGEFHAVLTQESITRASQHCAAGFDFAALQADLPQVAAIEQGAAAIV